MLVKLPGLFLLIPLLKGYMEMDNCQLLSQIFHIWHMHFAWKKRGEGATSCRCQVCGCIQVAIIHALENLMYVSAILV